MSKLKNVPEPNPPDLDWATAEDAYHIINILLLHVEASSDLIAAMASVLGESATKGLIETPAWVNYMSTRRSMEHLKVKIEQFSLTMVELAKDRPDRPNENEE